MAKKNRENEKESGGYWKEKTILVTGAAGFVGRHLMVKLKKRAPKQIVAPSHEEADLRESQVCERVTRGVDVVIHLAAKVGGIGLNREIPGEMFYDNMVMGVNLMEEARKNGVDKFVTVGTVCAYPKFTPVPFAEKDLWNGYPEETNAPYGLAKKMMLVQGQAYRAQYGFDAIYLLPANMYGPGDNFNPDSSHVIPALIKKFEDVIRGGKKEVVVWGTGKATREFLYVEDAVRGILLATEKYDRAGPVNLGSSEEISIQGLAEMIGEIMGYEGKVVWDSSKPDGQPRRKLDVSRAWKEFGFKVEVGFEEGLTRTIEWYRNTMQK